MKNMKQLKFTNELKGIGPKLKWFLFTEMQDLKLTSEYIDFICAGLSSPKEESNPIANLEKLVKQALIREFSPAIQNSRSFSVLVDAVMHNIQKKSLEEDKDFEEIDFE